MFVFIVKKVFKICGIRKYKFRCIMFEGIIFKVFFIILGRLSFRNCDVFRGGFL